ncbi:MAG: sugar phosphorylase [Anaerolineae bacterium]|jgi:sucrose phosphorylase|nr:sugar phosphorylase [Anaerolineae bacterium]
MKEKHTDRSQLMFDDLAFLYGDDIAKEWHLKLIAYLDKYKTDHPDLAERKSSTRMNHKDAIMITYGDMVSRKGQVPLEVLTEFAREKLFGLINTIHILPFFPYSSDDGFSVIDYKQVNPAWGDWDDIKKLTTFFDLMVDVVVNHISQHSEWFKGYKAGDKKFKDYFITIDPETDLSEVFRPRALPLLTEVETSEGKKWVWTTFSADQIDLNFSNPALLMEVLDVFLFYIAQGARFIRLDAVAFIWKEIGTNCLHLPQVHRIIELTRRVLDEVAPHVVLITETNVPHQENISYFGDGVHEAQMVYNFSLPPLVLHSIQTGNGKKMTEWAKTLELPSDQVTFFNFCASHDGVGLLPARGILSSEEIQALADHTLRMGGRVSYKNNPDGSKSPYEMNINYLDATRRADIDETDEKIADRFLASQSIMLALRGVPGIYYHSLLGSQNWIEGMEASGQNRTINREKLDIDVLQEELAAKGSLRQMVFNGFKVMLQIRNQEPAFDPFGAQKVIDLGDPIFCVFRYQNDISEGMLCLTNLSDEVQKLTIPVQECCPSQSAGLMDMISGDAFLVIEGECEILLRPYQVCWLKLTNSMDKSLA